MLSLLLATHQLHPHHLSKSFAYSLLITFPSFLQELPGASRWHLLLPCFPYSCHAHSFSTGCLWGSSHPSRQYLGPHVLFRWGLAFESLGLLFLTVSALPAFSLGSPYQREDTTIPSNSVNTTCCSSFPRPGHTTLMACLTLQHKPWCLPVSHCWIGHFHRTFVLAVPFWFLYPHPIFITCLLIRLAFPLHISLLTSSHLIYFSRICPHPFPSY